jgi:L-ribulokinase
MIIDSLEAAGVAVNRIVACGGLPERNALLMQLTADITGREVDIAASSQAPALGAAMHGAVAAGGRAGGHDTITDAVRAMVRPHVRTFRPDPGTRAAYDDLYAEYRTLHDYFGRGANDVLRRLRARRAAAPRPEAVASG